jgi:hypothetical protein
MVDTWYTFGAMVADPGFFPVIARVNPIFTLINMTVTENGGAPVTRKSAGYLDDATTTALRRAFRDYVGANLTQPSPIISLYTAGKFSQLNKTLRLLPNVFALANTAFVAARGLKTASPALLTAMGASLLDPQLANVLRSGNQPLAGDAVAPGTEFGLKPAEFTMLQTLLKDPNFNTAQTTLMSADCWKDAPCLEEFLFYEEFKRAVN